MKMTKKSEKELNALIDAMNKALQKEIKELHAKFGKSIMAMGFTQDSTQQLIDSIVFAVEGMTEEYLGYDTDEVPPTAEEIIKRFIKNAKKFTWRPKNGLQSEDAILDFLSSDEFSELAVL
jgi:ABC-type proline/glycine betaine transport system ATPase subunit